MRRACGRGERPKARIGSEGDLARLRAEAGQLDASVRSNKECRLLIPLEGQSGAERDDPQAQSRADRLQEPRGAG